MADRAEYAADCIHFQLPKLIHQLVTLPLDRHRLITIHRLLRTILLLEVGESTMVPAVVAVIVEKEGAKEILQILTISSKPWKTKTDHPNYIKLKVREKGKK